MPPDVANVADAALWVYSNRDGSNFGVRRVFTLWPRGSMMDRRPISRIARSAQHGSEPFLQTRRAESSRPVTPMERDGLALDDYMIMHTDDG